MVDKREIRRLKEDNSIEIEESQDMQMEISETHFKEPKQKKSDIIKFDIDD